MVLKKFGYRYNVLTEGYTLVPKKQIMPVTRNLFLKFLHINIGKINKTIDFICLVKIT